MSFPCEKFTSGACGNGKDGWNEAVVGDDEVKSETFDSFDVSNDDIIPTDIVENSGDSGDG